MSEQEWQPEAFTQHVANTLGIPLDKIEPPSQPVKVGDTVLLVEGKDGARLIVEDPDCAQPER